MGGGGASLVSSIHALSIVDAKALPPIRLIPFDVFRTLGQMPRCPENEDLLVNYDDTDREGSIYIFFSHCWLRGWPGAAGWDGRAHPDSSGHDKYKLMVAAVGRIMKTLTTMTTCYVWLDFGCINQDASACDELKMLDKIVGVCDLILTNVYDTQDWILCPTADNMFDEYKSPAWNGNDYAYLSRGWCRVEMLYAANIPLEKDSAARMTKFKAGLLSSMQAGRRPHLLYGTNEHKLVAYNPVQLPPLQNSWFDNYNPVKGKLTKESDREKIRQLVTDIEPYMKRVVEAYDGERNAAGQMHGRGVYWYADGKVYEGDWKDDKRHGRGVCRYASGNLYDGDYKDDKRHGGGMYRYASGAVYEGDWTDDKRHGRGVFRYIDSSVYEGDYKDDNRHGQGVYRYANGDVYEGDFKDGKIHGRGVNRYASGDVYEGDYKDGQMHGQGIYRHASDDIYEGDFKDGKIHGRGVNRYANGEVYEEDFKDGNMHGRGVFRHASGDVYEGDFKDGKIHGRGVYRYADGSIRHDGQWEAGRPV